MLALLGISTASAMAAVSIATAAASHGPTTAIVPSATHVDLGCFSDAIAPMQRGLPYAQRIAGDTTPELCEAFCAARGFAFSGTELRA